MPSNRGPSLADIMKNSKDIIQKSIYGTATKKPSTSSTQPKSIVEKKPPTKASKDSDSDSNSDDEDNNGSALNHLTSWMDEMQQPREKV
ncbi:hypothetical protein NQZ79_g6882 [Umbelopsis isabellina]|nr:hypothetical protein NQZ79_g6882 [Umbelopsis isabellina]